MNSLLNDPFGIVALAGVGAAVFFLFLWGHRRIQNPARREAFDEAIKMQWEGSELDIDTALNKSDQPKVTMLGDWFTYWRLKFEKAGQLPADPSTPGRIAIGAAVLGAALAWVAMGSLLYIVPGLALGPIAVSVWTGSGARKRVVAMEKQLPTLLSGLRANLQAGSTPQQAILEVARDLPSPLGDELRLLRQDLNVATALEVALHRLSERVPSREMQFLIASIEIAVRSGSALDPQLEIIEDIVEQRTRIRAKLRSAVAQVKPTKALAYGAPPLMFILTGLRNPTNRDYWFGNGLFMLIIAGILYAAGGYVIRIMVKSVENA